MILGASRETVLSVRSRVSLGLLCVRAVRESNGCTYGLSLKGGALRGSTVDLSL